MHHICVGLWNAGAHRKDQIAEFPGPDRFRIHRHRKPGMLEPRHMVGRYWGIKRTRLGTGHDSRGMKSGPIGLFPLTKPTFPFEDALERVRQM
jgi:hypothetical protein